jgi:thiopeptide-type bacteriocin biosynthesis protein
MKDVVIAAAAGLALPREGGPWSDEQRAEFAHLRDELVAAGRTRLARVTGARWTQVDLAFTDDAQRAAFLAGPLARWLASCADPRAPEAWFFMRKAPGLRLRLRGPHGVRAELEGFLADELHAARIAGWAPGFYEPEHHQFGGDVGMDIAHALFTHDSAAALQVERIEAEAVAEPNRVLLSLLVTQDLVSRLADGEPWEAWDTWCNMRLTGRLPTLDDDAHAALIDELAVHRGVLERVRDQPGAVIDELDERERAVVVGYHEVHRDIADRFRAAARADQLTCGPRAILPFCIIFHWNRWGLDRETQEALSFFMQRLLDPKQPPPG